jgi:hypothetical protein
MRQTAIATTIEQLKTKRHQLLNEVDKLDKVIDALCGLNGLVTPATPKVTEAAPRVTLSGFKRKKDAKGTRYVHGSISYYDVAVGLIKKMGRPVSNYEVYRELVRLTGKNLPRAKTLARIYACLYLKMDRSRLVEGEHGIVWNVRSAAELNKGEEVVGEVRTNG